MQAREQAREQASKRTKQATKGDCLLLGCAWGQSTVETKERNAGSAIHRASTAYIQTIEPYSVRGARGKYSKQAQSSQGQAWYGMGRAV